MTEDLATRQLNKARILISSGEAESAYSLLMALMKHHLHTDEYNYLQMQIFLLLAEATEQMGEHNPLWHEQSFEWLSFSMDFGQKCKARLKKKMRQAAEKTTKIR
jgi:hypothetical protein